MKYNDDTTTHNIDKNMRGSDISQPKLFVSTTVADFVPKSHLLRDMRKLVDEALKSLNDLFNQMYSENGKPSIAPERLLRASLLQVLYTIRSERQLCEQINYNMLYRWFVGLELDDAMWDHSTFSKNRNRLLEHDVIAEFFSQVLRIAKKRKLLSDEHFSVDGTLIEAWASHKSFRAKDDDDEGGGTGGREVDFHDEKRSNKTHSSTTDPDAELMKKAKGKEAKLSYGVHHLMENRNYLVVGVKTTGSASVTERDAAEDLLCELPGERRRTLGADKGYDTADFVAGCRELTVTPHVAQNDSRRGGSAIDGRTISHPGYLVSMRKRKMIETTFGWVKQYGGLRRMMFRGIERVNAAVTFAVSVFNLLRIRNIAVKAAG